MKIKVIQFPESPEEDTIESLRLEVEFYKNTSNYRLKIIEEVTKRYKDLLEEKMK